MAVYSRRINCGRQWSSCLERCTDALDDLENGYPCPSKVYVWEPSVLIMRPDLPEDEYQEVNIAGLLKKLGSTISYER